MKKDMPLIEDSRASRLVNITQKLQGEGLNVDEFAANYNVSPRTLHRDIKFLRSGGMPIAYDKKSNSFCSTSERLLQGVSFSSEEILALIALCRHAEEGKDPFFESMQKATLKLTNALPSTLQGHVKELSEAMHIQREPLNPITESKSVFLEIQEARRLTRKLVIKYKRPLESESFDTILSPYHLFFSRHSWYVVGYSSVHKELRLFHVGRILGMTQTNKTFRIPKSFSLRSYLGNAWRLIREPGPDRDVLVRFSRIVAQNVAEVQWHHTQQISWRSDGTIDFHAKVSGLLEIFHWILGYGAEAIVVYPEELRDMVRRHIQKMSEVYTVET